MGSNGLKRLESLDYLRGLMALAVLVFHYDKWTTGVWNAAIIQGKLGVYAVSIFFILSGMALTLTYEGRLTFSGSSLGGYARKRFARIFPLLWLATGATLLLGDAHRSTADVFLNFTGVFGFVDPSRDIATGAWSIGCELVFYAAFPLLLLVAARQIVLFCAIAGALTWLGMFAAFQWPWTADSLDQQIWWPYYVQVANHAWFFVAGMGLMLARNVAGRLPQAMWLFLLAGSALLFVLWPIGADPIGLLQGKNRVFLAGLAVLATASWCFGIKSAPGILHRVMAWLGAISYGLYLLHPLVFRAVKAINVRFLTLPDVWIPWIALVFSLLAGHVSFYYWEKPMMKWLLKGRK